MIEDEELRNLYKISGEECLQKLEAGLLHLTQNPLDKATLERLRREAHSLKGDSIIVGVENVVTLTHQVEEILLSIKRQEIIFSPDVSDRMTQGLDAIGLLVHEAVTGESTGVDTAKILDELMQVFLKLKQHDTGTEVASVVANNLGNLPTTLPLVEIAPEEQDPQILLEQSNQFTTTTSTAQINRNAPQPRLIFIEDEELRDIYQVASEQHLDKLADGLQYLQKHPQDEATLEMLRREVHSLKGDSRSVGVENVVTLTHQVEKIILSIKASEIIFTSNVCDRLYRGLDAIGLLIYEAVTGESSGVDTQQILDLMQAVLESQPQPSSDAVEPEQQLQALEVLVQAESNTIFAPTFIEDEVTQLAPTFIEDKELRDIYQIASEEYLQKLVDGLLQLEKHPSDEAILEQLLRAAHSLKGDSRSVGVESVITLTHQIEEIFLSIKASEIIFSPDVSDRLYQGLDAIGLLVYEAITGQPSRIDTSEILDQLMQAVSAPTIHKSLALPAEIPVTATQLDKAEIGQPYHIDTIRVQTRHFDALMSQAEELTFTKTAIAHTAAEIEAIATIWSEWKAVSSQEKYLDSSSLNTNPYAERLEKTINSLRTSTQENSTKLDIIVEELREKIYTLRLQPLSIVFQLLKRIVRDLARQQSKEVELIIEGGETTADKRILEEIKDSLMHMVRNAIDHGIETPAEREKLGKPPVATIWLRGYRTPTNIVIELADDGRGLDIEKIKQTAVKRGLYSPEELAIMTPSQIYPLILASGFSTQTFITEISGRGIGLDVVRTNVERLQGNIQIESTPGQGCTFRIQLNTTLGITNVVLFEVEGIVHALPIEFVQKTLLISQEQIFTTEDRATIDLDGQAVCVANLADLLEFSNPAYGYAAKEQQNSRLRSCILLKVGEEQFGLFVDRMMHTQEIVIKPQSQLLKRVRNVMGATILGSGEVCMILNPPDLLKSLQQQNTSVVSIKPRKKILRKRVILLVEDSIPVRTQEKRLLEKAGYEVAIAVDGLDGYNKLKTRDFDAVISDVEMPNLDGLSLTAKIRQHEEYKALPIILVTTLASDEDIARGSEAGANAYIIKSNFNQDFLLEILGRLV
ncbi:CheA signal transduction histidine kinase [Tolypothrix sp. NIES-4075]|uniref:hybrid sensor histidine kinase/response regulator n=1 Tax=Tolypothrix sp. NIES-4075 TaxID=2005459 RepID=UPI000B5C5959|nr:Hpt domain-containing protein [Tolypothrix sp. NIES-4075]GAX39847.1 CheA signal transduction histidine kinase [Tolypothrix sp. NIES-4075]